MEDVGHDGVAVATHVLPAALHVLDHVAGQTGLRVHQVLSGPVQYSSVKASFGERKARIDLLERPHDAGVHGGDSVGPGRLRLGAERGTELLSEHLHGDGAELLQ